MKKDFAFLALVAAVSAIAGDFGYVAQKVWNWNPSSEEPIQVVGPIAADFVPKYADFNQTQGGYGVFGCLHLGRGAKLTGPFVIVGSYNSFIAYGGAKSWISVAPDEDATLANLLWAETLNAVKNEPYDDSFGKVWAARYLNLSYYKQGGPLWRLDP